MAIDSTTITWHGTPGEQHDPLAAGQHRCSCVDAQGTCTQVRAGHRPSDQHTLDACPAPRRAPRHQGDARVLAYPRRLVTAISIAVAARAPSAAASPGAPRAAHATAAIDRSADELISGLVLLLLAHL